MDIPHKANQIDPGTLLGVYPRMASHHSTEIRAHQCLWLHSWQPTRTPTPEGWMKKMWILYTMAFSAIWKTGYHLQNMVATGDDHAKWIQPVSEREIACFLSSVGPRFYTYVKSYMYLRHWENGKLRNRKMESWQEESLGEGQNTFKFILYLNMQMALCITIIKYMTSCPDVRSIYN